VNLNKPVLTSWQKSATAGFIQRHTWFFEASSITELFSVYTFFLVYLPAAILLISIKSLLWGTIIFAFSMIHLLAAIILIESALEGTR
jgi:hypothetical protein